MNAFDHTLFDEFDQDLDTFMYEDLDLLPIWYGF